MKTEVSASVRKADLLRDAESVGKIFDRVRDQLIQLEGLEAELAQARVALASVREETEKWRVEAQEMGDAVPTLRALRAEALREKQAAARAGRA